MRITRCSMKSVSCRRPAASSRSGALLCIVSLLSACAAQRIGTLPALDGWDERQRILAGIGSWGFSGRIAVRDGEEGFNGNLHWEQRRDYFDARVSGPLGAGTVLIAGDAQAVTVTDDDGEVTTLADPEIELRQRYGWHIPVTSLRFWALGIPDPARPAAAELDGSGRLARLEQDGWVVTVDQYRDGGGQPMPRRLAAVRDGTRVRLVIDRWSFH